MIYLETLNFEEKTLVLKFTISIREIFLHVRERRSPDLLSGVTSEL